MREEANTMKIKFFDKKLIQPLVIIFCAATLSSAFNLALKHNKADAATTFTVNRQLCSTNGSIEYHGNDSYNRQGAVKTNLGQWIYINNSWVICGKDEVMVGAGLTDIPGTAGSIRFDIKCCKLTSG